LRRSWPALAPLALATACATSTSEGACTLIGCSDGLVVRVEGVTDETPTTIEIRSPLRSPVTLTCTGTDHCAGGVQLENQTPGHVQVTITSGSRVKTVEADLEYVKHRPNGPGCEPECRQATLLVMLTEA
jgi:hypothetical protein